MYNDIQTIPFEGAKSKNPFSFRYYDKNRVIAGKTMAEHLRFAMSWWHTCCAAGTDMFGGNTMAMLSITRPIWEATSLLPSLKVMPWLMCIGIPQMGN